MPQTLAHDLRRDAGFERERCPCVAKIVKANSWQVGARNRSIELARANRRPSRPGKPDSPPGSQEQDRFDWLIDAAQVVAAEISAHFEVVERGPDRLVLDLEGFMLGEPQTTMIKDLAEGEGIEIEILNDAAHRRDEIGTEDQESTARRPAKAPKAQS